MYNTATLQGTPGVNALKTQDLTSPLWIKQNVSVSADVSSAGTWYTVSAMGPTALIAQVVIAPANNVTYAIFAKQGSGPRHANRFAIYNNTTGKDVVSGTLDYETGVLNVLGDGIGSVMGLEDGWFLIKLTTTAGVVAGHSLNVYAGYVGNPANPGEFGYVYGPQLIDAAQDVVDPDAVIVKPGMSGLQIALLVGGVALLLRRARVI